jgi:Tol biopolymer transport system component
MDMKSMKVREITEHRVGHSFFWSPDGIRVLYRELLLDKKKTIKSRLQAFDIKLNKKVSISEFDEPTGLLTYDPRDLRFSLLTSKGVHTNRLKFPDKREARWQMAARDVDGRYLVTQTVVLWLSDGGLTMKRLETDGSKIQSFDISPDGLAIVYATEEDRIWFSEAGAKPTHFDYGRDPKWHPARRQIIYAGARRIGSVTHSYDLKLGDTQGNRRFITQTQTHNERWPVWARDTGRIYFTRDKTTDLYEMDLM